MSFDRHWELHQCSECRTWTGEQINVVAREVEVFLRKTPATVIGEVRLTSPTTGF